ncbi:uncharacterized protein B0I36DRAFT_360023 [Microdochium trichocladiopsis]|uniref:Uncharacterized protein n=1 Tax=Microdochium trichocladiopsis TaxID=1682393 RepID=A0A9P8Y9X8_9PEZI|nr:uncharacterized protein B0I36DRAFT_360023 [Microdochium trichocladiopsis]KAH7034506.1 hypothetical protein B0I36DRAFT_360023 [Microdochium trichocladiopsis]
MSGTPKRKRGPDVDPGAVPEGADAGRPEPLRLESVDKYPRKRVMIALLERFSLLIESLEIIHYRIFLPPALKDGWNRAFWVCSLIIDELEQSLRMHLEGYRAFYDIIPLPTFTDEYIGFYFFLAMISLRKLL